MKKLVLFVIGVGLLIIGLTLLMPFSASTSIAQDDPTPAPTPHDHAGETDEHSHADGMDGEVTADVIETGHSIYLEKGCNECHGLNSEGNDIGPALAGHTREDVYRQLRAPVGIMPPFGSDEINFREVEFLVAYVVNLPINEDRNMNDAHSHTHGTFRLGHVVVYHHWYALYALQENNTGEAIHHVSHIIEFTEGPHQVEMQAILEQIVDGDLDTAELAIADMLFGIIPPETPQYQDYVRIALVMIQLDQPFHAVHYLEHSGEMLPIDSELQERFDDIIILIETEDMSGTEEQLQAIIAGFDGEVMADMDGMDMGGDSSGEHMHTGLALLDELISVFEDAGATVSLAETLDQSFFTVEAQVVLINEIQALQVYEYPDEKSAMAEVALVAPSGSPIGTSQVSWMMPPHFYHSGHLVVIYIGADADTLELLDTVLGNQFAGQ